MRTLQIIGRFKFNWKPAASVPMALLAVLCGCGGPEGDTQQNVDEGLPPEAVAVRKAFESAPPSKKNPVIQTMGLIRMGRTNRVAYWEVLPQLETMAKSPTLSPEQKQALDALIQRLKSDLSAGGR